MADSDGINKVRPSGAELRYVSPLRYPGGKQRLGPAFAELIAANGLSGSDYVEPFAGGAGVGLYLLRTGLVRRIFINDLDRSIYAFWMTVTQNNLRLCRAITKIPLSIKEWDRQREVQRHKSTAPLFELGLSTLYLNRANRSGILRAGAIGGRAQKGDWSISARFNRVEIARRIEVIGRLTADMSVTNVDARTLLKRFARREARKTFIYIDPPYFCKGPDLYLNKLSEADHRELSDIIRNHLNWPWVLTYDDVPIARNLYRGYKIRRFHLDYSARARRVGREIMVLAKSLIPTRLD